MSLLPGLGTVTISSAETPRSGIGRSMEDNEPDPVEVPIEDAFDLHPFRPRDVKEVAGAYLEAAWIKGFQRVRLIHGRGIGVQREIIRSLLSSTAFVVEYHDADPSGGGWGATEVVFAPRTPPDGSDDEGEN